MKRTVLGIIGGSGLYELPGLKNLERIRVETPFGEPSSEVLVGTLGETQVLFISRHGAGHTLLPSEINYRANIYALKKLGAVWCLSVSAVGSLQEEAKPGELVVPDQFIDRTRGRVSTFFGSGIVAHVSFATPFCPVLRAALLDVANTVSAKHNSKTHNGGTYICMEGPAFSTRAESRLYRNWGGTVIGMTNLPEAKLAREAELAYATLAMVTDYDCWRSETDDVDIEQILRILGENAAMAKEIIATLAPKLSELSPSELARDALKLAIITPPEHISPAVRERLKPIIGRYVS